MLQDIPEKVFFTIVNIVGHLDLLNLILVCKKFNQLISNNSQVIKIFAIYITKNRDDSYEWNGTRKYSQLDICKMHWFQFIAKQ